MPLIRKSVTLLFAFIIVSLYAANASAAAGFDVEKTYESVYIVCSGSSLGSGFAIDKDLVVTNAHVINDRADITIKSYHNDAFRCKIAAVDYTKDVAVLIVENAAFTPVQIGSISDCEIGDDVYAIGAPKTLAYTLTKGVISAKERVFDGQAFIQIDVAINEGNSGGPLLTSNGEVIGINTMTLRDASGISMAIPVEVAIELARRIRNSDDEPYDVGTPDSDLYVEPNDVEEDGDAMSDTIVELERSSALKKVLIAVLAAMVMIAAMVIWLVYKKNRAQVVQCETSDRTNFDIDIMG